MSEVERYLRRDAASPHAAVRQIRTSRDRTVTEVPALLARGEGNDRRALIVERAGRSSPKTVARGLRSAVKTSTSDALTVP